MVPLFKANGDRNPISYNGLSYNTHIGGSKEDIIEVNYCRAQYAYDGPRERRDHAEGLEVYTAFPRMLQIVQAGVIKASSRGELNDRLEEMATAFDPAIVSRDNPDDFGFLAMDFDVPTANDDDYPTLVIPSRYYVRSEENPVPPQMTVQGNSVPFSLVLLARDPRRYHQTVQQLTGAGAADNSLASRWSWPTLTIAMTGAGDADFTITNTEADMSLVLDLSGLVNLDSVAVDMERRTIKVNGEDESGRYVSGDFFHMEPGINTITVANTSSASPTLSWRPAFAS